MKYTIAIPAYKSEFLKECIDSILNQTLQDFELIIVDDASPYPIKSVVSQFNDPRISYYCNTANTGAINVVDTWNKCLSLAQGEYFCLMGDDDILDKEYLSEMDTEAMIAAFGEYSAIPSGFMKKLEAQSKL